MDPTSTHYSFNNFLIPVLNKHPNFPTQYHKIITKWISLITSLYHYISTIYIYLNTIYCVGPAKSKESERVLL